MTDDDEQWRDGDPLTLTSPDQMIALAGAIWEGASRSMLVGHEMTGIRLHATCTCGSTHQLLVAPRTEVESAS